MWLIEADDTEVRVGVTTFRHPVACPWFVLFPMVHLGEPSFFEEVATRVGRCDVGIVEGAPGRAPGDTSASPRKTRLDMYDRLERIEHLGLTVQKGDYGQLVPQAVYPDRGYFGVPASPAAPASTTSLAALRRWRPPITAMGLWAVAQILRFDSVKRAIDRRTLAELTIEVGSETPDRSSGVVNRLTYAIAQARPRDQSLVRAITEAHDSRLSTPVSVAVVYGGAHMHAVVACLEELGYQATACEWLTVFRIEDSPQT